MKRILAIGLLVLLTGTLFAQEPGIGRIEPPNWWSGFRNPALQLMVYGKGIGACSVTVDYAGVKVVKCSGSGNPNYLFVDLLIGPNAKPGSMTLKFHPKNGPALHRNYELKQRKPGSAERKGFGPEDAIYLLMPDRFANGDFTNDNVSGMKEPATRQNPDGRHGGDLKGITSHLDYLQQLGATALWLNPVLENNMEKYSYHGYATTNYYAVDPRFGSNDSYFALSDSLHRRGMKLIMDMVFNHCGSGHWWMDDLPAPDWLNNFPEFTQTSYRSGTMVDPYCSKADRMKFQQGWFDRTMPDLNQHNPYLATYLIQNSIWWIEAAGLDGIRQDTYPYCYPDFMARWDQAVLKEYPHFNIVGECWLTFPAGIAYWQKDALNADHYNSYLPSVLDFAMYDAIRLAFMENDGWNTGMLRLYETLSQDFLYPNPDNIVVFADNHDVNRCLDSQNDDIRKLKMALAFVLTSRGIPQIYYGTEVLLTTGTDKGDGQKRKDFPGGWASDTVNAFIGKNLSPAQADMLEFTRKLMNWRKSTPAIHTGKLTQFVPKDGIYAYFRYNDSDTVMVVFNNNEKDSKKLERIQYEQFLSKFTSAKDVVTGTIYQDISTIELQPKTVLILELIKEK